MNKPKNKLNFSLIIIGDFPVGKTSICDIIFNKNFQESKVPTIGTQFQSKIIKKYNKSMNITVWDTSSILIYKTMIMNIIRKVNGIFLVFDVTNINSFNSLSNWINNLKTVVDLNTVLLYIIANKIDLGKDRVIKTEQIKNFCKEENLIFFETSAKLNIGINEAFDDITSNYFNKLKSNLINEIFIRINKKYKIHYFPNLINKIKLNDLFIFSPLNLIQKLKTEDNYQIINEFEKNIKEQNLEFFDEIFELFKFYITFYLDKSNNEEMNNLFLSEINNFIELFYYQKKYIIYFIQLFANFINNHRYLYDNENNENKENDENKENNENNENNENKENKENDENNENNENKENNENNENDENNENKEKINNSKVIYKFTPDEINQIKKYFNILNLLWNTKYTQQKSFFLFMSRDSNFSALKGIKLSNYISFYFNFDDKYIKKNIPICIFSFLISNDEICIEIKLEYYKSTNEFVFSYDNNKTILNFNSVKNINNDIKIFILISFEYKKILFLYGNNKLEKIFKSNNYNNIQNSLIFRMNFFKDFIGKVYSILFYNGHLTRIYNKILDNQMNLIEDNFLNNEEENKDNILYIIPKKIVSNFSLITNVGFYDYFENYEIFIKNVLPFKFSILNKIEEFGGYKFFIPIFDIFYYNNFILEENNGEIFYNILNIILNYFSVGLLNNVKNFITSNFFDILFLYLNEYPNLLFNDKLINIFENTFKYVHSFYKNEYCTECLKLFSYIEFQNKFIDKNVISKFLFNYLETNNSIINKNFEYKNNLLNPEEKNKKIHNYQKLLKLCYNFDNIWILELILTKQFNNKLLNHINANFQRLINYPIFDYKKYVSKYKNNNNIYNEDENFILPNTFSPLYIKKMYIFGDHIFECCLVKMDRHIRGKLQLIKQKLIFNADNCNNFCKGVEICKENLSYDLNKYVEIDINKIAYIFPKIFTYKKSALEIYLNNGKIYFFNFNGNSGVKCFNYTINYIIDNLKDNIFSFINDYNNHSNNIVGYYNKNHIHSNLLKCIEKDSIKLSKIISLWKNFEFNNFFLIIILNLMSNRSLLNLYQYFIFPLLFIIDNNENITQRDLEKTLNNNSTNIKGTYKNYSNYENVKKLLSKLNPFAIQTKSLYDINNFQDSVFDLDEVERQSFFNITKDTTSDSNNSIYSSEYEIIPESFYLCNLYDNGLNDNILNVKTIIKNLKTLESENVSKKINKWIDLIFGKDQTGKNAIKLKNIYQPESYLNNANNNIKFYNIDKLNYYVESGFVPIQLFTKEFEKKNIKNKSNNIFVTENNLNISFNNQIKIEKYPILKFKSLNKSNLFINGKYLFYNEKIIDLNLCINSFYFKSNDENFNVNNHIAISNDLSLIIIGGLENNSITIISNDTINNKLISLNFNTNCFIISALFLVELYKNFIIIGDLNGNIFLYEYNNSKINLIKYINSNHYDKINHIYYNEDLNLFTTCGNDGYINIYTFPEGKIVHTFKENTPVDYAFIVNFPIPTLIVYSQKDQLIKSFLFNWKLYEQIEEKYFKNPLIYTNHLQRSYLIYLCNSNSIKIVKIPCLKKKQFLFQINDFEISCIDIPYDKKTLNALSKKGNEMVVKKLN